VMQIVLAVGLYSVGISVLENPEELSIGFLLTANLIYVPSQWIMLGAAVLLIGALPKATGAVWGYFALSLFLVFFGRMNIFPEWMQKLTPLGYVPQLPMDEVKLYPLLLMTLIAAVLTAAGFYFYSKRDINATTH